MLLITILCMEADMADRRRSDDDYVSIFDDKDFDDEDDDFDDEEDF